MKKLKRFLIIGLFSFIFCINSAYALTTFNPSRINTIDRYLNSHPNKTVNDWIDEEIMANFEFPSGFSETDDHVIIIEQMSQQDRMRIYYLTGTYNISMWNSNLFLRLNSEGTVCDGIRFFNSDGTYYTNYNYTWNITRHNQSSVDSLSASSTGWGSFLIGSNFTYYIISSSYDSFRYEQKSMYTDSFRIGSGPTYNFNSDVPSNFLSNSTTYNIDVYNRFLGIEPTYEIQQEILENGNVKLTFNFTNYEINNGYGFTITNKVNGEEYGIENPFTSIYPNIIPFGNSYEIMIPYDTVITVSLSKYTLIDGTELYDREPIYVDSYDINNIVFSDPQKPYFSIISQTQDNLIGRYHNTKNNDICGHIYSNNNVEWETDCNSVVDIDFSLNGYVEMYVKRNNNIIYSRKINYIAQNDNQPYIIWTIDKQDFYSVLNWTIKNYNNQMTYRYSKDNGQTYTTWSSATENNYINVYDNNTIIIEIANNDQSIIYDTKAINVVNNITNLGNKNNTTINFIDKFGSIFSTNENILNKINEYWALIKNSKLYLLIFIPFITSIICGIIYMIRRK